MRGLEKIEKDDYWRWEGLRKRGNRDDTAVPRRILTLGGGVVPSDLRERADDGQAGHVGGGVLAPPLVLVPVPPEQRVPDLRRHRSSETFQWSASNNGVANVKLWEDNKAYVPEKLKNKAKNTLVKCAVSGKPSMTKGQDLAKVRTKLNQKGVEAITAFVEHRGLKKGWRVPPPATIKQYMGNVLCEERAEARLKEEAKKEEAAQADGAKGPINSRQETQANDSQTGPMQQRMTVLANGSGHPVQTTYDLNSNSVIRPNIHSTDNMSSNISYVQSGHTITNEMQTATHPKSTTFKHTLTCPHTIQKSDVIRSIGRNMAKKKIRKPTRTQPTRACKRIYATIPAQHDEQLSECAELQQQLQPVPSSLRRFHIAVKGANPFVQFVLRTHAATLEEVHVLGSFSPHHRVPLSTMHLLAGLPTLRELTLHHIQPGLGVLAKSGPLLLTLNIIVGEGDPETYGGGGVERLRRARPGLQVKIQEKDRRA
ncbi:hypothetical protein FOCC_FOCC000828 [Frankliniella occidentalis]|nr:hypothetical protein FOCC_FOCC000828 [Frankliniella occidentalis]